MKQRFYMLWSACGISLCLVTATSTVQAQSIKIDGTTPTTPATCSGTCNIEGGLQRGNNLFHSFSQFNVEEGARVIFIDPGVTNILTRVTGNEGSNIRGTLGVSGGQANLFLINPNGIIFGENAKLEVGGSFVGSTASAIRFGNQGFFRASASEIPLLTVNPSALFYQSANGPIENRSSLNGLSVPDGKSLLLVGGEVNLNGGKLNAFGGRIELGGLAERGEIGLDVDNNNLRLSFPENTALADVSFSNGAIADVTNGGGSITLNAGNIGISGKETSLLSGIGRGIIGGQAGDITLNATGSVTVTNGSIIFNRVRTGAQGNSGNINIKAGSLSLSNGGQVLAATLGTGNAGNLNIDVRDGTVAVIGNNSSLYSSVEPKGIGNAGNIKITAKELSLKDGGFVNAGTYGHGNAGNIFIQVSDLVSLESKSVINTGIFSNVAVGAVGNAGEINIKTSSLSLSGGVQIGASVYGKTQENPGVIGSRGNILVNADSVTISGASLDTGYSSGLFTLTDEGAVGAAGNITVNTRDFRLTDGATVNAQTRNSGAGGNITINTTTFEAINGGQVFTTASNSGNAGNISVNADSITLSGKDPTFNERSKQFPNRVQNEGDASGLFASTRPDSTGSGGDIAIATQKLTIQDEAQISVSSKGKGDAGNIDINAHNISLYNQGKLTSETASGQGGDITLQVRDLLLMRRKSQISTDAANDGDGGKITINAPNGFIVAPLFGNSDITANANFGSGGTIKITTKNIFGFVRRKGADIAKLDPTGENKPSNLLTNDITAFSQQNPSLDGNVQINSPDADPSKGLAELPVNLVDTSQQIVADCNSSGKTGRSSFIATGRGGLVDDPTQPLIADDAVLVDWIALSSESKNRAEGTQKRAVVHKQRNTEEKLQKVNSVNEPTQIVEAQGWVIDADGNVVLVAQVPTATPHNLSLTSKSCPAN
ncbi:MAG: filamentous hemagglutinin N-terminal domain-containing protein [Nostoc sp. DedVER02]|uniref:two-partner secretion domain-containing protein n=1 Tax=unclassified Nostoc TaxID=2593658 RepID=UPI002AD4D0EB|nr:MULTISPECIES: filamentous hemagglutinin N-terminal domain-containing protein [unclassified Nostoc]MDZ7989931.1 filamentous hemagglutinin N-terminal domain-containing protein [Nostoc sp. DedVER02]MDZ8112007.1 filamentous hemagglutinin N-terminal domain-containing protein [Nostoc sp. DedVER01b]